MSTHRPPTIDPIAAARWAARDAAVSPWLHEEVARRMESRLQWIVQKPTHWMHWEPVRGGLQTHGLLMQRYPAAQCYVHESTASRLAAARAALTPPVWSLQRWRDKAVQYEAPSHPLQMLWANMALHMHSDPQALIAQWHSLLDVDGFLMFSCLGPDTLRQMRELFARQGWPVPAHEFTDMHDWGDMLVHAGFAEPVMDMERITLTFSTPEKMLAELRDLGRNLHPLRTPHLRGRGWRTALHTALAQDAAMQTADGRLALSFEVIYGHAFKSKPRLAVQTETTVSLQQMRDTLRHRPSK